jgi:hypothetical protein
MTKLPSVVRTVAVYVLFVLIDIFGGAEKERCDVGLGVGEGELPPEPQPARRKMTTAKARYRKASSRTVKRGEIERPGSMPGPGVYQVGRERKLLMMRNEDERQAVCARYRKSLQPWRSSFLSWPAA